MGEWARAFGAVGRTVAQLLLTHQDLAERMRRNNAIHTIQTLLEAGVIPIVNENDTVAVEEIRMGDNDVLSSLVAGMVQAQLLMILSDVRRRPDRRSAQAARRATDPAHHRPRGRDARAGGRERGAARKRRDGDQAQGGAAGGARRNRGDYRAGPQPRMRSPPRSIRRASAARWSCPREPGSRAASIGSHLRCARPAR